MLYTFETKLTLSGIEETLLDRDLHLWNKAFRVGFNHYSHHQNEQDLYHYLQTKTHYSKQSKSLVNVIVGKHQSLIELNKTHKLELDTKIKALTKTIKELHTKKITQEKKLVSLVGWKKHNLIIKIKALTSFIQKKEQALQLKQQKLILLNEQIKNNTVSICFGGKKLLKQRNSITQPKAIHNWEKSWDLARNNQRIAIGDKSTPYGNPEIQFIPNTHKIKIRLSETLAQERIQSKQIKGIIPCRFVEVESSGFPYLEKLSKKTNLPIAVLLSNKPITAKLLKRENGFYVQITVEIESTQRSVGLNTLGVDFNADGLAYVIIKPDGNRKTKSKGFIALKDNTELKLSEKLTELLSYGAEQGCKDIAIEALDFFNKKSHMRTSIKNNKPYNKMLSQLRYQTYQDFIIRKAERLGWQVHLVNPAYSSLTGCVKWAFYYRESIDIGSAQAIGRQSLKGKPYQKNKELKHIIRHQLKKETISEYRTILNWNQNNLNKLGKKEECSNLYKEIYRVLGKRNQWKSNLAEQLLKAQTQSKNKDLDIDWDRFDPFECQELEIGSRQNSSHLPIRNSSIST